MLEGLKVTLYDIFGYFLPGSIALGAVYLYWSMSHGENALSLFPQRTATWLLLGFIAYYLGHMLQGLGNVLEWLIGKPRDAILGQGREDKSKWWLCRKLKNAGRKSRWIIVGKRWEPVYGELLKKTKEEIEKVIGPIPEDDTSKWLYESCAEVIAQHGTSERQEVYEYREGFYRGSAIAFVLLAVVLSACACFRLNLNIVQNSCLRPRGVLFAAALSLVGSGISFHRYGLFAAQGVRRTLLGFLVLRESDKDKKALVKEAEESYLLRLRRMS
jgi:hypothetical protein